MAQLCYKYDIDVALCSSGAIFAAVCSDFSHVVFSQLQFLPRDASAERGNAIVSRPSVCLSVCLSVCDV